MKSFKASKIASQTSGTNFDTDGFGTRNKRWRVLQLFPVAKKLSVTSTLTRAGIASLNLVSVRWITGAIKLTRFQNAQVLNADTVVYILEDPLQRVLLKEGPMILLFTFYKSTSSPTISEDEIVPHQSNY